MTIRKFVPIFQKLPEAKGNNPQIGTQNCSADVVRRHGEETACGNLPRATFSTYIQKRRSETLFRCGEWTNVPVSDGTIRNELVLPAPIAEPCAPVPRGTSGEEGPAPRSVSRVLRGRDARGWSIANGFSRTQSASGC